MSDKTVSDIKEVYIEKKSTTMSSEEYISIHLKSAEDTIDVLLQKAMNTILVKSTRKKNHKLLAIQ